MALQHPTVWDDDVDAGSEGSETHPDSNETKIDATNSTPRSAKRIKLETQSSENGLDKPVKNTRKHAARFNEKWITEFKWIKPSERGPTYAFCRLCNADLSIASGGRNDLTRHLKSSRHVVKEKTVEKGCIPNSVPDTAKDELLEKVKEELTVLEEEEEQLKKNEELREIQRKIHEKELSIKKLKIGHMAVAFTAVLTKHLSNLGQKQSIVFDNVVTNIGSAYNSNTGIFTAPVQGVYSFTIDMFEAAGENLYSEIVKDGNHVVWNYCHAEGAQHYVSASKTVVLQLEKGNQVWVRVGDLRNYGTGKLWGNGFSSFTGFLLTRTE